MVISALACIVRWFAIFGHGQQCVHRPGGCPSSPIYWGGQMSGGRYPTPEKRTPL